MKKSFFIKAPPKRKGDCKYMPSCDYYSSSSYTCIHNGGSYCGRYRKLDRAAEKGHRIDLVATPP